MTESLQEKIAIIGIGRLGASLARALCEVGCEVIALSDRNREKAIACAKTCGDSTNYYQINWLPHQVSMIFLTVPDDQITATAGQLLECRVLDGHTVVVHTSGAVSADALSVLQQQTSLLASVHPVQTFSGGEEDWKRFYGIYYGVEGHNEALRRLYAVIEKLKGRPFLIPKENKSLYHLGCVFASNYLLSVIYAATSVFEKLGLEEAQAIEILEPLIVASTNNARKEGVAKSATGPITRGDVGTINKHLLDLQHNAPELINAYKALGRILVDLVKKNNHLSDFEIEKMLTLLAEEPQK